MFLRQCSTSISSQENKKGGASEPHRLILWDYGNETVSDDSKFEHCAVGVPEMLAVPVILESESQNKSTAFPLIVERGVLLIDRSMLELLIATRPS